MSNHSIHKTRMLADWLARRRLMRTTADAFPARRHRSLAEFWTLIASLAAAVFAAASAGFTAFQAAVSRDTEKRELRPYIEIVLDEKNQISTVGNKPPYLTFSIKNYGQTPAYNVRTGGSIDFNKFNSTLPPISKYSHPSANIPPQEKYKLLVYLENNIDEEINWIHLRRRIEYSDIFGDRHVTYICIILYPKSFGGSLEGQVWGEPCPLDGKNS